MGNTANLFTAQQIWNRVFDSSTGKIAVSGGTNTAPNNATQATKQAILNTVFDASNNVLNTN
jgi:hypothetical protein